MPGMTFTHTYSSSSENFLEFWQQELTDLEAILADQKLQPNAYYNFCRQTITEVVFE